MEIFLMRMKVFFMRLQCETIAFLVPRSDFCLKLREDDRTNRLLEAETTFDLVWNNRFLRNRSVILFLNKQDLLKEAIEYGVCLDNFFPDYADFKSPVLSPDRLVHQC